MKHHTDLSCGSSKSIQTQFEFIAGQGSPVPRLQVPQSLFSLILGCSSLVGRVSNRHLRRKNLAS